jgi:hypothetical protein
MKNNTPHQSALSVREMLRQRFPDMSDTDLDFVPGHESEFVDRLQRRTGESHEFIVAVLASAGIDLAEDSPGRDRLSREDRRDVDHSRGSGIPDDTSRSGATGI